VLERPLYGVVNRISDPSIVEVIGRAGFDFVMIDCEHAPYSWPDVQARVVAAQSVGMRANVRVPSATAHEIGLALDLGADGVHVPHVRTLEDADAACDAAYYAPKGMRGFALSHRGAQYGTLAPAALIATQNEALVVAHIEDVTAVESIDQIASCDRVSVLFVAPFDLSYGLGVPGDLRAEALWQALDQVATAASKQGRACGTFVTDYDRLPRLQAMGYRYFLLGGDLGILASGLRTVRRSVEAQTTGGA
jgi:4-hydroxy-2-oxoheptanedioate aldolase